MNNFNSFNSFNFFKLCTFNLNGIRSAVSKGLENWLDKNQLDCLCVQELKAQNDDILTNNLSNLANLKGFFHFAQKKGYSGVGIYSKFEPSDVIIGFDSEEFDFEGRYVEARFDSPIKNRKFSIISSYFPSGSSDESRQEAKFRFLNKIYPHLMNLKQDRDFILCGDINIAHKKEDLKNWKTNQKNSGFTPEERAWLDKLFYEGNLKDVYRHLEPKTTETCYSWWSFRFNAFARNTGWRIDYHIATEKITKLAKSVEIQKEPRLSDHAPVIINYDLRI